MQYNNNSPVASKEFRGHSLETPYQVAAAAAMFGLFYKFIKQENSIYDKIKYQTCVDLAFVTSAC